ncbi:MAG: hypothetical protein EOO50_07270 [Flavobacterium sp.]|uniref:hypothetical protein n=1 Tax=Flavobacterium sp. TaxID=239 RepID=UPI0011F9B2E1|nr:hypothetical protein [Flavobacterium sp.]RZJ67056.1 MAG: hypothetical protein EOO50_07270 [Flavobacterium sp.]
MKKVLTLLALVFITSASLVSCSSDDGGAATGNANLLDKWWYSPDNTTTDIRFNSDGTYQSTYTANGMTLNSDGEWEWSNESAKEMHVFNVTGNALTEWHYKFNTITAHTMTTKFSYDDGETWSEQAYPFTDSND